MASDRVVPERASAADLDPLASTFVAAFADDPMIRWPMPDATSNDLHALFRAILAPYLELGVAWTVGRDVGCAAWLPPAHAARFTEIEIGTRAAIYRLTRDGGERYCAFWDWIGSHLPEEPCWFLDIIAVRPDARRPDLPLIHLHIGRESASLAAPGRRDIVFRRSSGLGVSTISLHRACRPVMDTDFEAPDRRTQSSSIEHNIHPRTARLRAGEPERPASAAAAIPTDGLGILTTGAVARVKFLVLNDPFRKTGDHPERVDSQGDNPPP